MYNGREVTLIIIMIIFNFILITLRLEAIWMTNILGE